VNIPSKPRGLCWTKQSLRHYDGRIMPQTDPMGRQHFWVAFVPVEQIEKGTDRWALQQQFVSITPLRLDLTDERQLTQARTSFGCSEEGVIG
ncbi:MAG TPA: 5'/3'-nucleotidase SurE, partial [Bacteroidia bacterium]|nr:5'/3'-nucleotidase SurE [Bacteroidia bacterium]